MTNMERYHTKIIHLLLGLAASSARNIDRDCSSPLGLESGSIPDSSLLASSSFSLSSVGPSSARLNSEKGGGAWCPKNIITEKMDKQEFLEIDLKYNHIITSVVTQGRFANGQGQEFAEFFILQYWREGMEGFMSYSNNNGGEILPGNKNTFTEVETLLEKEIVASKVRVVPFSYHPRTVCMRMELKGCPFDSYGENKT